MSYGYLGQPNPDQAPGTFTQYYSRYEAQGVATVWADLTSVEGTRKHLGGLLPTSTIYMASERVKSSPQVAQHLANAFVRTLKYINS